MAFKHLIDRQRKKREEFRQGIQKLKDISKIHQPIIKRNKDFNKLFVHTPIAEEKTVHIDKKQLSHIVKQLKHNIRHNVQNVGNNPHLEKFITDLKALIKQPNDIDISSDILNLESFEKLPKSITEPLIGSLVRISPKEVRNNPEKAFPELIEVPRATLSHRTDI